jgi:hypothetical protein
VFGVQKRLFSTPPPPPLVLYQRLKSGGGYPPFSKKAVSRELNLYSPDCSPPTPPRADYSKNTFGTFRKIKFTGTRGAICEHFWGKSGQKHICPEKHDLAHFGIFGKITFFRVFSRFFDVFDENYDENCTPHSLWTIKCL